MTQFFLWLSYVEDNIKMYEAALWKQTNKWDTRNGYLCCGRCQPVPTETECHVKTKLYVSDWKLPFDGEGPTIHVYFPREMQWISVKRSFKLIFYFESQLWLLVELLRVEWRALIETYERDRQEANVCKLISGNGSYFSLRRDVQPDFRAHPPSYRMGTKCFFIGEKRPDPEDTY